MRTITCSDFMCHAYTSGDFYHKSSVFWDISPCRSSKVNRRFGGTCCLHEAGSKLRKSRDIQKTGGNFLLLFPIGSPCVSEPMGADELSRSSLVFHLLFNHEDGGDMFLRNVGWLSKDYTTLYPKRYNSS
jgi:hypothetical protein